VDAARKLGQRLSNHNQRQNLRKLNRQLRRTLSEKEALLAQKDLLMKEVDHRVQNSLQLVGSMLYMYARESSDIRVKTYFEEAIERITAISTVHKHLWISDSVHTVDFGPYMDELRTGLIEVWGGAWRNHIKVKEAHVHIPTTTAVILALVVTELLTNAVKYAYQGKHGPIEVTVECEGRDHVVVTVEDQGVGIGKEPHSGFGSRLTRTLLEQLKGKVQVTSKPTGTSVSLTVPLSQPA
jgi:two-component sensor histidine kinase